MKNFKSFLKEHPSWDHPENPVGKDITDPVIIAKQVNKSPIGAKLLFIK